MLFLKSMLVDKLNFGYVWLWVLTLFLRGSIKKPKICVVGIGNETFRGDKGGSVDRSPYITKCTSYLDASTGLTEFIFCYG